MPKIGEEIPDLYGRSREEPTNYFDKSGGFLDYFFRGNREIDPEAVRRQKELSNLQKAWGVGFPLGSAAKYGLGEILTGQYNLPYNQRVGYEGQVNPNVGSGGPTYLGEGQSGGIGTLSKVGEEQYGTDRYLGRVQGGMSSGSGGSTMEGLGILGAIGSLFGGSTGGSPGGSSWADLLLGGIGTYLGYKGQKEASQLSSQAMLQGSDAATKAQLAMYDRTREDMLPFMKRGDWAGDELKDRMLKGPGEFEESPGYLFRRGEGEKSVNRYLAARGMSQSGPGVKAMLRYNQDYATNEYDKFLNRYYQSLTPYQSMAGLGQTATAQQGQIGTNVAQGVGQNQIFGGQARASGYLNEANARTGAIQNISDLYFNMRA